MIRLGLTALLLSSTAAFSSPVRAQQPAAGAPPGQPPPAAAPSSLADALGELEAAIDAYERLDFSAMAEHARRAIERGGLSLEALARAYHLLGDAETFLSRPEQAHAAYLRLLAVTPEAQPNSELNPQMQLPFQRARAFWNSQTSGLRLSASAQDDQLHFQLDDPLDLVATVQLEWGYGTIEQVRETTAGELPGALRLDPAQRLVRYRYRLRDRHGNLVAEAGHGAAPLELSYFTQAPAPLVALPPRREQSTWVEAPWVWMTVGAVAVTATVVGVAVRDQPDRELRPTVRF